MQTTGKGWKFRPGLFKEDLDAKSNFILIQLISSFMFLKTFAELLSEKERNNNLDLDTIVNDYKKFFSEMVGGDVSIEIDSLHRFYTILNYETHKIRYPIVNSKRRAKVFMIACSMLS
jgi:hypothetical protein